MSSPVPEVHSLEIQKLPEGGYLVGDAYGRRMDGFLSIKFAATTIEEALKYLKSKLEPKATK